MKRVWFNVSIQLLSSSGLIFCSLSLSSSFFSLVIAIILRMMITNQKVWQDNHVLLSTIFQFNLHRQNKKKERQEKELCAFWHTRKRIISFYWFCSWRFYFCSCLQNLHKKDSIEVKSLNYYTGRFWKMPLNGKCRKMGLEMVWQRRDTCTKKRYCQL